MAAISTDTLVSQLEWRYATKRFDAAKKIPAEVWQALEQALLLSPSSFGLQPWSFVVVTDPALREKLRTFARNQPQITESSHLVVFAVRKNLDAKHIEKHIQRVSDVRGVPVAALEEFKKILIGGVVEGPLSLTVNQWAQRQVYIALGNFLTSAALLGVDACPMEGFEADKFDVELGLNKMGLAATVLATAGYRSPECKGATTKKVRFAADDVIIRK